jgi:hypothetical protein
LHLIEPVLPNSYRTIPLIPRGGIGNGARASAVETPFENNATPRQHARLVPSPAARTIKDRK